MIRTGMLVLVVATACSTTADSTATSRPSVSTATEIEAADRTTTDSPASLLPSGPAATIDDYPDAALRAMWQAMRAPRPVEGSAMPPRHLNAAWFPDTLVDRNEIVPGGPPPDGIPSIDEPEFAPIAEVDDLEPQEAVLVLDHGGETRIYPVRIMIWHEIVNDVVADTPVTVTYCPLCNSAIAYERELDGRVLDFGTSGYLYRSGLVMYDRQTETLWTHFDGRAVIGALMGEQLEFMSVATVSWEQANDAHPDALVLRADGDLPYGRNRYAGYDQAEQPLSGWFNIDIPEPIPPMTRVVGVRTADEQTAIPTSLLTELGVVDVASGGRDLTVFWSPGTASPLHRSDITAGDDIGSTGVFDRRLDGRLLTFEPSGGEFVDRESGSTWNIRGRAIAGPLAGSQLREVPHLDTFWFAWVAHHPDTRLLAP